MHIELASRKLANRVKKNLIIVIIIIIITVLYTCKFIGIIPQRKLSNEYLDKRY